MRTISYEAFRVYARGEIPGVPDREIGYFQFESDARTASRGVGSWGGDAVVEYVKVEIPIFGTIAEYRLFQAEDKIKAAMAKLTEEDRKVLGLK